MTDKQIKEVFKNGFYCIEPCPEIKELQAKLKRKEQECETLTSQLDFEVQKKECLEQECEELEEQLELNTANAVVIDMAQRLYKLKQTLTEIKEIAETCSFTDNIQLLLNRFEQILQKISEISDGRSPVSGGFSVE